MREDMGVDTLLDATEAEAAPAALRRERRMMLARIVTQCRRCCTTNMNAFGYEVRLESVQFSSVRFGGQAVVRHLQS